VITVRLPPLRARKTDIPLLVNHLIEKHQPAGQPRLTISEGAMNRLTAYDWPGNVRELENCIERAVALGSESILYGGDWINAQRGPGSARSADALRTTSITGPLRSGWTPSVSALPTDHQSSQVSHGGSTPDPLHEGAGQPEQAESGSFDSLAAQTDGAPDDRIIPLAELERRAIHDALRETSGDKILAARLLGIGKTTLYRKLKEYGVIHDK
jgi:DNA-binding NtrC family response regulator